MDSMPCVNIVGQGLKEENLKINQSIPGVAMQQTLSGISLLATTSQASGVPKSNTII
jgi:hypothetical protein